MEEPRSRYRWVSRRALLKASAGLGAAIVLPGCGNNDVEVFAGAVTDLASQPEAAAVPTTPPITPVPEAAPTNGAVDPTAVPEVAVPEAAPTNGAVDPTAVPDVAAAESATADAAPTDAAVELVDPTAVPEVEAPAEPVAPPALNAVAGEMVIGFTYTQGVGGKNERPYIVVWIEDQGGELLETVSLWYEQGRRGARWLDHLDRWWEVDQTRIARGGVDDSVVISSATRQPGSYTVAWDGTADGVVANAGRYFICIEAAREEGPVSLVRQPFDLAGSLAPTALPDNGELSAITVQINV